MADHRLRPDGVAAATDTELVSIIIADQLLGIPVYLVRDILGAQRITPVPLAPREVAGALNLRGRIVTAIDLRVRLGLPPRDASKPSMSVVVEHAGELYSLLFDQVGEVLQPPKERFESDMVTLTPAWREFTAGIYRLDERLLVLLDVSRVLGFADPTGQAA